MSRHRKWWGRIRPLRWFFVVGCLMVSIRGAQAGLIPPPLLPFDWTNQARTLDIQFAAANGFPSPDTVQVADRPGGVMFTFGDAVRQAANAWNMANTGWMLNVIPPGKLMPPDPVITVDFANLTNAAVPHVPANTDVLAVFVRPNNQPATARIDFNTPANVDWGIQGGANAAMTFDPIIVALHELGHALRLDHEPIANSPNGMGVIDMNTFNNDSVMEPMLSPGVHELNPNPPNNNTPMGITIFPNVVDIKAAMTSASKVPEPATIVSLSIGLGIALGYAGHRHRRKFRAG
jgi:hypothetical protein